VQTASCVDHHHIGLHLDSSPHRVEGHGSRICAFPVGADGGHADTLTPRLQLVSRGRAEGVGGTQHDVFVPGHQDASQLAYRRGLACPVDSDHHHHGWTALDP